MASIVSEVSTGRYCRGTLPHDLQPTEAERHLRNAIVVEQRMSARPWEAYARFDLVRVLVRRDAPGDGDAARAELDRCLALARDVGMGGLVPKVETLATEL